MFAKNGRHVEVDAGSHFKLTNPAVSAHVQVASYLHRQRIFRILCYEKRVKGKVVSGIMTSEDRAN